MSSSPAFFCQEQDFQEKTREEQDFQDFHDEGFYRNKTSL